MTRIIFSDSTTQVYCRDITPLLDRQKRHVAEQQTLRLMVKELFGADAIYSHRPDGSPVIENADSPASISVSHGADKVVIAISTARAVGVDIEAPRPQLLRVAHKFMAETEIDRSLPDLLQAWTIKEAIYKAADTPGLPLIEIPASTGAVEAAGFIFNVTVIEESDFTLALAVKL